MYITFIVAFFPVNDNMPSASRLKGYVWVFAATQAIIAIQAIQNSLRHRAAGKTAPYYKVYPAKTGSVLLFPVSVKRCH